MTISEDAVVELSLLQDRVERLVVDLGKTSQAMRQTIRSLPATMPYAGVKGGIVRVRGDMFHLVENLVTLLNILDGLQGRVTAIGATEEEDDNQ